MAIESEALFKIVDLARAEAGKAVGTLSVLIQAKEAAAASTGAGSAHDMLNDEIILLGAMRSRFHYLLGLMQEAGLD